MNARSHCKVLGVILMAGLAAVMGACSVETSETDTADLVQQPGLSLQAGKPSAKTELDTPLLSAVATGQTTIDVTVCGGAITGAPAGFSVQWISADALAANGGVWPVYTGSEFCKASFSGNADASTFNLAPGQCATVTIGEVFDATGASMECINGEDLLCGTTYVFRAFAHATSTLKRSPFTADVTATTLACDGDGGCTFTQGYWKTHCDTCTPNTLPWPVTSLTLGNHSYTAAELEAIFVPASGNGLLSLAHQLIAAKLNIANGADSSAIDAAIAAADALIGDLIVGVDFLKPSVTSALTNELTNYNEGLTGPGHCE
jgi:hypothetical protein